MKITNIKPLYRYENADHSITITLNQKSINDLIYGYRIIADENYELYFKGKNKRIRILDVLSTEGWTQEPVEETVLEKRRK